MDNGADPMPDEKGEGRVVYIREKRHAPRRRLWLPSHLIDEAGVTHACLLLELSTLGAAVRLDEAQDVAAAESGRVVLVVGGNRAMRHHARVVRREGDLLALGFVASDDDAS